MDADTHRIDLPKRIIIGNGVVSETPNHILELGLGRRIVVVCGHGATNSYANIVKDHLVDSGLESWIVNVSKASTDEVAKVSSVAREVGAEVLIGVGGGKAIDAAKYAASRSHMKFISIPTTPSHDGIASPFASIRDLDRPVSTKAATPALVIADIDIISKAPRRNIIAGCCDLIGKFSAVLDWRLAHRLRGEYYGEYAASLALLSAKHIVKYSEWFAVKDIPVEAIRVLVEALISSGIAMAIAGSTRPASGSEHMIAHAIDVVADYPALHGEEVGIGSIVALYLHGRNWKRIRNILRSVGAAVRAKDVGISRKQLIEALTIAHKIRPERYTILGEQGISIEAAEKIVHILELD
ncbi:MAG: NAD(P)-dependent glycerol-1-phosphate dehydrogenase [Ignisphaera sp.]|nr:NAD(P)-dependent glycerol-1-phosphate dehydrogenase [Ignisphaera sp.]MCX8167986.1 NAD(P)-dependent glycerol-1-phosphate dehydrogenase [Ignisphaera sp.]MDW8085998.1 NAD(P)-dependent glycerol-1-phosphate dehydrogenase [Ignisphaera sp.]